MAIAFVCFFFLMLIHELGHAAMAKWRRVPVLGIELYIMHGLCRHEEPHSESDAIWIAWGGVIAQGVVLLMAVSVSVLLQRVAFPTYLDALPALHVLISINTFLIVMNLVPVPPLDGAIAWRVAPKIWARTPKPSLKRWLRNRQLQRQSKEVAADIIERFKKKQ